MLSIDEGKACRSRRADRTAASSSSAPHSSRTANQVVAVRAAAAIQSAAGESTSLPAGDAPIKWKRGGARGRRRDEAAQTKLDAALYARSAGIEASARASRSARGCRPNRGAKPRKRRARRSTRRRAEQEASAEQDRGRGRGRSARAHGGCAVVARARRSASGGEPRARRARESKRAAAERSAGGWKPRPAAEMKTAEARPQRKGERAKRSKAVQAEGVRRWRIRSAGSEAALRACASSRPTPSGTGRGGASAERKACHEVPQRRWTSRTSTPVNARVKPRAGNSEVAHDRRPGLRKYAAARPGGATAN